MIFLIALAEALVFVICCRKAIGKYPGLFYGISVAIVAMVVVYQKANLYAVLPEWTYTYIVSVFWRGAFATALFVIVMFLGAIEKRNYIVKQLMPIRGNLAIMASLITLAHSIVYGKYYITAMFATPQDLTLRDVISLVITLPLFTLMIVLMATSFTKIRRRMKPATWKKLQKLSYVWFALLYVYLMELLVPSMVEALMPSSEMEIWYKVNYVVSVAVYTLIFGSYLVLRVRKEIRDKTSKKGIVYRSYEAA